MGLFNRASLTTSVSSKPYKIITQRPRGVPTIPITFGYPPFQKEILESANLDWSNFQHI